MITEIPPEKFFYVSDGTVIRTLYELPDALRRMSPEVFKCHVNSEKNDFHNWALGVFNNTTLARKIKGTKNKELMAKKVFTELFS